MNKRKFTKIIFSLFTFLLLMPFFQVSAQLIDRTGAKDIKSNLIDSGKGGTYVTGGQNDEPGELLSTVATTVVSAVLGLLGIIFLIMVILGGFNWMTAAGNEDKVTKAKATLFRGVIGLFIVVAAYVITIFVFKALGGIVGRA